MEAGRALDRFPRYDVIVLLGDFNANVGKEDMFKPTVRDELSQEISNDNGVSSVNFDTSKT
jgi:hypothetical protein